MDMLDQTQIAFGALTGGSPASSATLVIANLERATLFAQRRGGISSGFMQGIKAVGYTPRRDPVSSSSYEVSLSK